MPISAGYSNRNIASVLDTIPVPIFLKDPSSRIVGMNPACEEQWGIAFSEIEMTTASDYFPPHQMKGFLEKDAEIFSERKTESFEEIYWSNKLKEDRISQITKTPVYCADGTADYLICVQIDITDRINAERARSNASKLLSQAQRIAKLGSWSLDLVRDNLEWSDEIFRIFEVEPGQENLNYQTFLSLCHPDDRELVDDAYNESIVSRKPYHVVHRLLMRDGRIKWVEERGLTHYDFNGAPTGSSGTVQDVTSKKIRELAMECLAQELVACEPQEFYDRATRRLTEIVNSDGAFISWADPEHDDELLILSQYVCGVYSGAEYYPLSGTLYREVLQSSVLAIPSELARQFPNTRWVMDLAMDAYVGAALFDRDGNAIGKIGVVAKRPFADISAVVDVLKIFAHATAAFLESGLLRREYETLFEFAPDGLLIVEKNGVISRANRRVGEIFGWNPNELEGQRIEVLVPPAAREAHVKRRVSAALTDAWRLMSRDRQNLNGLHKAGRTFPVEVELATIPTTYGMRIAAAVRDVSERRRLEEQLAHSTRMEALGKLTGGMAHDFNNYLAVIIFNLDLLNERFREDKAAVGMIEAATRGALKGAGLIQSLVAFARKQPLAPKVVQLNSILSTILDLLQGAVGESVIIQVQAAPKVSSVLVDPSQLESALLNLASNARDAMPKGGLLSICLKEVEIDERDGLELESEIGKTYVLVEVKDTGRGMAPEVAKRVFEPFFTTKDPGQGTGLGLSMVYGFVKQSKGFIQIDSIVDVGTTVRIYFPALISSSGGEKGEKVVPRIGLQSLGGTETILVVEDKQVLRETLAAQLQSLGYQVVLAKSGEEALAILRRDAAYIDLLFSDVVMPGSLDGYELAQIARMSYPHIRILLTSGYPDGHLNVRDETSNLTFLTKPYRLQEMALTVKRVLNGSIRN